jgi:REP element-mobilizing transposase RayT
MLSVRMSIAITELERCTLSPPDCYQRRSLLGTRQNRDLFLQVLERVRRRYHFVVVGYVVMPERIHLLLGEPLRAGDAGPQTRFCAASAWQAAFEG